MSQQLCIMTIPAYPAAISAAAPERALKLGTVNNAARWLT